MGPLSVQSCFERTWRWSSDQGLTTLTAKKVLQHAICADLDVHYNKCSRLTSHLEFGVSGWFSDGFSPTVPSLSGVLVPVQQITSHLVYSMQVLVALDHITLSPSLVHHM